MYVITYSNPVVKAIYLYSMLISLSVSVYYIANVIHSHSNIVSKRQTNLKKNTGNWVVCFLVK